jgi:hypothetical protein
MIYAVARGAGFSPDQSATMTAIALAESGGNTNSHNPVNEDSRGLWQINAQAHPDLAARFPDLYNPAQNAKAAFLVSNGGKDMSPWTTTHGGPAARYLRYRSEAEQAAIAYGDGPGHGVWTGTAAYGDHESAGSPEGAGAGVHAVSDQTGSVSAAGQATVTGAKTGDDPAVASAPAGSPTAGATAGSPPTANAPANATSGNATTAGGTGSADGSNAVTVADAAAAPHLATTASHDSRPGADYGIPLAAPAGTGGTQTLDAPGHPAGAADGAVTGAVTGGARLGADFGIPLAGSEPTAASAAVPGAATSAPSPAPAPADHAADSTADHAAAPAAADTVPTAATQNTDAERLQEFLHMAVAQTGDRYVYGANADFNDPHPSAFDCSDLVQWATHRVGISMPRTASEQYEFLKHGGHVIPVDQAVHTPGALLFNFSSNPDNGQPDHGHVAISLGNGKTMEALGTNYGVGSWNANSTRFNYAAVIPGLSPGPSTPAAAPSAAPDVAATSDVATTPAPADVHKPTTADLVGTFEARLAADPHALDTQPAVLDASRELTGAQTDPAQSDPAQSGASADHAADHPADPSADLDHSHDSAGHTPDQSPDHHDGPGHDATADQADHPDQADHVDHTDPALASALLWSPPTNHHHPYTDHGSAYGADAHDAGTH